MGFSLPKQSLRYRSTLHDGSRSLRLSWKGKTPFQATGNRLKGKNVFLLGQILSLRVDSILEGETSRKSQKLSPLCKKLAKNMDMYAILPKVIGVVG